MEWKDDGHTSLQRSGKSFSWQIFEYSRNEEMLPELVRFARREMLLLRFIELMPVTTTDVPRELQQTASHLRRKTASLSGRPCPKHTRIFRPIYDRPWML